MPWRRKWQPTPVFLPGKFHGQSSLVGYSLWGHKGVGHDWATKQQHKIRQFNSSPSKMKKPKTKCYVTCSWYTGSCKASIVILLYGTSPLYFLAPWRTLYTVLISKDLMLKHAFIHSWCNMYGTAITCQALFWALARETQAELPICHKVFVWLWTKSSLGPSFLKTS